ncbi:hypothetical protein PENSPDRAFT_753611 [Peniophora sp. CONT]|nr:hypothetical protein PENSPDRAFT_753611 [Peniophora sp. CONT]
MSEHGDTQSDILHANSASQREAYAQEIRDGPTSALEHLRLLWNQRPPGMLSPECDLVVDLTVLSERFVNPDEHEYWEGRGIVRDVDQLGADLWAACIKCNLLSLLTDMALFGGLETQSRPFFMGVLACITGILAVWAAQLEENSSTGGQPPHRLPPNSHYNELLLRLKDLCSSLWNARNHMLTGPIELLEGELLLLQLLGVSTDHLLKEKGTSWRPKKLAHISIYAWISFPPTSNFNNHMAYHAHLALRVFTSVYSFIFSTKQSNAPVFVADILQQLGIERILSRVREVLGVWEPSDLTPSSKGELVEILYFSQIIVRSPTVWDAYCQDPMFSSAVRALSRSYAAPVKNWEVELSNWSHGSSHLRIVIEGVFQRGLPAEKVSSADIWLLLTLGVRVALGAMLADTAKRSLTNFAEFKPKFEHTMGAMTQGVGCCLAGLGGMPLSLVHGLQPAARNTWYPILRRVRDARVVCGTHPLYDLVESSWAEFGRAFGLVESSERDRFESMRTRMCSWEACEFNVTPSPTAAHMQGM